MSRSRFCSFLLAGISCWLFLSGCISVEVESKAARDLSGSRKYRITLEPMLARVYRSGASARLFDLPGQDLDKKEGVLPVYKKEFDGRDGSLILEWSYRAKRMESFSEQGDSISFSKRCSGLWIYYDYFERYSPRKDTGSASAAGSSNFISRLSMPGQIISYNGDSLRGSQAVWIGSTDEAARNGLSLKASSREVNPIWLVVLSAVAGLVFYFVFKIKLSK